MSMNERPSRRAVIAGLAALGLGCVLKSGPASAAPLAKVKADGVLRVAVYQDNRPWSWSDGGNLRGIDVDLGKALAESLGVRADVVEFPAADDLNADLRNVVWRGGLLGFRPCDVMLHVPFDRQLMVENDQVAVISPYYREGFAMVCGNEQTDCEVPPSQFNGKRLAAETGTVSDAYLLGSFGGVLRSDVRHFGTGYAAVAAVGTDKADVALATRAQVEAAQADHPAAAIRRRRGPIPALVTPGWDIGMAVKENSRSLGDALEESVARMIADGRLAALFKAHGVEWHAALAG
ncbi:transporter substrate-binding domain-containing protein [Novosphingobium sp.]|uniref:transporter substrate-binding domain-containing protein n=1 Tax=Novosphingobium sp. TaxID=1874826 RepID=UPI0038BB7A1B